MLSNKDKAIQQNLDKEHVWNTFVSKILIDNDRIDDSCENCYEEELFRTCHVWTGQTHYSGYGIIDLTFKNNNKVSTAVFAHRFAYASEYGFDALPKGTMGGKDRMVINHMCHNRACVNPRHLEVITQSENVSSAKRKPKVLNG